MRGALLLLVLLLPAAAAHVPQVAPTERDIEDPGRSYAFYDELAPGETHTWTFDLSEGDALFVHVSVPLGAAWTPRVDLVGPTGAVALERVERVGYEFATPYAAREVWTLDTEAPTSGRYALTIQGDGGRYALGFGLAESFTPLEWIRIPIDAIRIHAWQGQPWALQAAPFVLAVVASVRRIRRDPLRGAASALFLGSAASTTMQMGIALASGAEGPAWTWIFTSVVILLSSALARLVWTARHAWALAAIAIVALVVWSGLLVGPVLALAAALAARKDARVSVARGA